MLLLQWCLFVQHFTQQIMRRVTNVSIIFLVFFSGHLQAQKDLPYYIQQAKNNSPLIQFYKNQIEASGLENERLKAFFLKPQVSLTANFLLAPIITSDNGKKQIDWNPYVAEKYRGYDLAASNGGMYAGLLNVNQPLFNGNRYKVFEQQTLIDIKAQENNQLLTEHELEKTVTDQYIQCVLNYRQVEYTEELLNIINQQEINIGELIGRGVARPSDLSLLVIEQKAQEVSLNKAQSSYRNALLLLRMMCGLTDTTYQVVEDPNLTMSPDVDQFRFVERYRLDSLTLMANQKIFDLRYKPITTLFANTGLNAVDAPTIPDRFGVSTGINFSITLTDGKQRSIMKHKTEALMKSTRPSITFFNNQNSVRKNKIKEEFNSVSKRLVLMEEELIEFQKLLSYYNLELAEGKVTVFNYLAALKSMTVANRDYVSLLTEEELLINEFNYWNW